MYAKEWLQAIDSKLVKERIEDIGWWGWDEMNYEKEVWKWGRVRKVEGHNRVKNKWRQILGEKGLKKE